FLAGAKDDSFRIERERGSVTLHSIRRLRSEADCTECHASGATLGAATMQIDLTEQMGVAHRSIRRELALLITGWAILVGIVNIVLEKTTRRSLERLQLGKALEKTDRSESTSASGLLLDPVSAELYESFANFRESRRNLDAEVATRLRRAEHMASLGQMAAGLAHEIKNPLAGIRGVVELLRDESEDESQRNLFQEIVKELDRVNRTIHLLLRFARPSAPNRVLTDVRALIEDSVRLIRPSLEKRSISLDIRLEPDVGRFPLDSTHMRHVLTNLVTNAADAIENQDGGRISVSAIISSDGKDLSLAVADNGPGIEASLHERVFEPFFSTKFTGTGLGLAVVESLVSRSGGVVELFSVPGRGTTVYVLLPSEAPDDEWVPLESKGLVDGADFIDRR
ncbi:MAG: ATP-binding protein, partial [Acidobacteriota bacterium]